MIGNFLVNMNKQSFIRSMSNQGEKILVIAGGTSTMASHIALEAFNQNYTVHTLSRTQVPSKRYFSNTILRNASDKKKLIEIFFEITKNAKQIVVVNTIGGSIGSKEELINTNEKPAMALAEALQAVSAEKQVTAKLIHLSTIAASIYPNDQPQLLSTICQKAQDYCNSKITTDLKLMETGLPVTILRPGYVFSDPLFINGQHVIDTGHPYSPEQLGASFIHPIMGCGTQIQQPVHMKDVVDAILQAALTSNSQIVNAVGPDNMTQKEMFAFFAELLGNSFRPIHIPYPIAEAIARHCPKGRIAPYSVALFKHIAEQQNQALCSKDFEELVGRPLISMSETYKITEGKCFVAKKPPIFEHLKEISSTILSNPLARKEIIDSTTNYGSGIVHNFIKSHRIKVHLTTKHNK